MQKTGLFQADVNKGRFHTRQYPIDLALVNITDDTAATLALDADFLQRAIFDNRDPGFLGRDV
jgi:hypothetical protein